MKRTTLSLLLIFISLIQLTAQTDSVWVIGTLNVGKVTGITAGVLTLETNPKEVYTINLSNITKLVVSQTNPNKQFFETTYMIYLSNKSNNPQNSYYTPPPLTSGFYLKRGANRQLAGIIVSAGSLLIGGTVLALSKDPVPGIVVIGIGDLTGFILGIAGISDYKMAGELLDRGNR
jgi:hypothetical protein